jgi:MFS family permease
MGVYNSVLYAPMTLLVGGFTDKVNRKNLILSSCFVGGFFTLANAFVTDINYIIVLRISMGFISSLFQPASYSIINDYFPPTSRTKAFFIYQILGTFADIIQFESLPIISLVGWRGAYMICGGLGIITPIIGVTFLKEPPNPIRIKAEEEERKLNDPEYKPVNADGE